MARSSCTLTRVESMLSTRYLQLSLFSNTIPARLFHLSILRGSRSCLLLVRNDSLLLYVNYESFVGKKKNFYKDQSKFDTVQIWEIFLRCIYFILLII